MASRGNLPPDAKRHENSQAVVIENDLQAAIEVRFSEEMKVLYPNSSHTFHIDTEVNMEVTLREDRSISGNCVVSSATSLRVSESFGSFGPAAAGVLASEQQEVAAEAQLRRKRQEMLRDEHEQKRQEGARSASSKFVFLGLFASVGLVVCGIVVEPKEAAVDLTLALSVVMCFVGCCCMLTAASGFNFITKRARWAAQYGSVAWMILCCLAVAAGAVRYVDAGFWWIILVPGLICCCCLSCTGLAVYRPDLFQAAKDLQDFQKVERSIVFHGKVLGKSPCIASWPGKYKSAWDSLVANRHDLSAAVVFLPEDLKHFGYHLPIPAAENLPGSCWCSQLYGEKKVWGCKWWTKWLENIEQAVAEGAELEVYYFEGMVGKGKVEHFLTAGKEHLRREEILGRKADFMKSEEFLAIKNDLENLQKEPRGDSTSQYSREVQRLFLASLSEEDRRVMEASEGLGNSQKAEVAWLDWKGYRYTEVDVSTWIDDQRQPETV